MTHIKAMKNSKLRIALFSLILLVSLSSYMYINSIDTEANIKCNTKQTIVDEEEKSNSELPDVKLIKKIIEKGKQLVPATRF